MDDGKPVDPWFGSIGEVRIVDHPLGPDQWLTARASDNGDGKGTDTGEENGEGQTSTSSQTDTGAIVGGVIGGFIAGVLATLGGIAALLGTAADAVVTWVRDTLHINLV